MNIMTNYELTQALIKLRKKVCCISSGGEGGPVTIINLPDDNPDPAQINTIQITPDGQIFVVDGDGNVFPISGGGAGEDNELLFSLAGETTGSTFFKVYPEEQRMTIEGDIYSEGLKWTLRDTPGLISLPDTNAWLGIAWSPDDGGEQGRYVVASQDSSLYPLMYSDDSGNSWTRITDQDIPNHVNVGSIAYGNGIFVLMQGAIGATWTSTDGLTWSQNTAVLPTDYYSRGLHFLNGLFISVDVNGSQSCWTSADGISWDEYLLPAPNQWMDVGYSEDTGRLVAVSLSGSGAYSDDMGVTWTDIPSIQTGTQWHGVEYGNGVWVAVGSSATSISTSSDDGISWVPVGTNPLISDNQLVNLAFGNGVFSTLTVQGQCWNSTNGTVWTQGTLFGYNVYCAQMIYGERFMAADTFNAQPDAIYTSTDGFTYTLEDTPSQVDVIANVMPYRMAYGNGVIVATTIDGDIALISEDGIRWETVLDVSGSGTGQVWSDITYADDKFIMVKFTGEVFASYDGKSWFFISSIAVSGPNIIAYGNGAIVLMPQGTNDNKYVSYDGGLSWNNITMPEAFLPQGIGYGNGTFMVTTANVSPDYLIYKSTDGTNWTPSFLNDSQAWGNIAYGGGKWIAVNNSNNISAAVYSADNGATWTYTDMPALYTQSLAYGNGMWIIAGNPGKFWYSFNGINFIQRDDFPDTLGYGTDMIYVNGMFISIDPYGNVPEGKQCVVTSGTSDYTGRVIQTNRPKFKKYVANVTQSGTGDPVATILENDFPVSIVWARSGVGNYTVTATGQFPTDRTVLFMGAYGAKASFVRTGFDTLEIITNDPSDTPSDDMLLETSFEIRSY
jgi:hypothetical protein